MSPSPFDSPRHLRLTTVVHYAVYAVLLAGAAAYVMLKPPFINPMADASAAEAMALVQTHRAQQAETIRQAITDRVQGLEQKGQGVRLGEWRVERERPGTYVVQVSIREQGTVEWFERRYVWRVDIGARRVTPLTLPAASLMPMDDTSRHEQT